MEFALWYVETLGSWKKRNEKWKNRVASPRKNVWTCLFLLLLLLLGYHRLNYRVAPDVITYNELSARTTERPRVYIISWYNTYRYIPRTAGMFLSVHERIFLKKRLGAGFIIDFKTGQRASCREKQSAHPRMNRTISGYCPLPSNFPGSTVYLFLVPPCIRLLSLGPSIVPFSRFIVWDYICPFRDLFYPSTTLDFLAVQLFNDGAFPSFVIFLTRILWWSQNVIHKYVVYFRSYAQKSYVRTYGHTFKKTIERRYLPNSG